MAGTICDLEATLHRIDGRGYGAYKDLRGTWRDRGVDLEIEHVQGDPFATPSRVRIRLDPETHGIPEEFYRSPVRAAGLCDFLLREFHDRVRQIPRGQGMGNSGRVLVDAGGAEILPRSGCTIRDGTLELRLRVGLPARGRTVLGRAAAEILTRRLPDAASRLAWKRLDSDRAREWVLIAEEHDHLQRQLRDRGLVAFVRDGSVLPRASGVAVRPLEGAVPFASPPSLRVSLPTLHHGEVAGMGVPEGVVLITGGGFHGKTTLLQALQLGVYPHVPGDGREWVVTRADTVKVRSEDGRAVERVDLRPFIQDLPGSHDTAAFRTPDASGSTSLAAAIMEALEMEAGVLLLDEDTSATNLLIRDARMQELVRRETITPLIDRVRELHEDHGVSTLLVVGGSGDYLDVATLVLLMEDYLPQDVTERARAVASERPTGRTVRRSAHPFRVSPRFPRGSSFDPRRGRREKVKARGTRELVFGQDVIDLDALEQLVDDSQARAIGVLLKRLGALARDRAPLRELIESAVEEARDGGIGALDPSPELAMPRVFELAGAVNRLRSLKVDPTS